MRSVRPWPVLTTDDYLEAASLAAPIFGLEPSSITLLSHSENVVCQLTLPNGARAALRIHRPGYNSLAELRSEVLWVTSLSNFGIPVPTALSTDTGDHYVSLPVGGQAHHVGVVDWVPGEPLGSPTGVNGPEVVQHYGQIGKLAAQVRAHHAGWAPPAGFTRRAWDHRGLVGSAPLWGRFWEVDALSDAQRRLFSACRDQLLLDFTNMSFSPGGFGMIHSDLHLGNLMADGDSLTMIDFDDAGFGWFAHELAVALHPVLEEPWEDDARSALIDGYRTVLPLSAADEASIDTFVTMRSLMIIGWLDARRELPAFEHFGDLATQAERISARYLAAT